MAESDVASSCMHTSMREREEGEEGREEKGGAHLHLNHTDYYHVRKYGQSVWQARMEVYRLLSSLRTTTPTSTSPLPSSKWVGEVVDDIVGKYTKAGESFELWLVLKIVHTARVRSEVEKERRGADRERGGEGDVSNERRGGGGEVRLTQCGECVSVRCCLLSFSLRLSLFDYLHRAPLLAEVREEVGKRGEEKREGKEEGGVSLDRSASVSKAEKQGGDREGYEHLLAGQYYRDVCDAQHRADHLLEYFALSPLHSDVMEEVGELLGTSPPYLPLLLRLGLHFYRVQPHTISHSLHLADAVYASISHLSSHIHAGGEREREQARHDVGVLSATMRKLLHRVHTCLHTHTYTHTHTHMHTQMEVGSVDEYGGYGCDGGREVCGKGVYVCNGMYSRHDVAHFFHIGALYLCGGGGGRGGLPSAECVFFLRTAVSRWPPPPEVKNRGRKVAVFELAARVEAKIGNCSRALQLFEQVVEVRESHGYFYVAERVQCMIEMGRRGEALQLAREYVEDRQGVELEEEEGDITVMRSLLSKEH
uniref:Uncharacterized protein n=1 Tax=Palpitomonas bilix TaxID=652834 RepID=A0A7S3DGZ8_9EUKA